MKLLVAATSIAVLSSCASTFNRRDIDKRRPSSVQQSGFVVMNDQQEALDWFTTFEKELASSLGKPPRKIYPATDARYAPLKEMIAALWQGFFQVFPDQMGNLPTPHVVLIEDSEPNSYAVYDPQKQAYPLLFIVHTEILKAPKDQQYGLFAHELGHLVFRHGIPQITKAMKIFYRADSGYEPLGFLQKSDKETESLVTDVLASMSQVGPYFLDELHGVPLDIWGQALYTRLLLYCKQRFDSKEKPECERANASFEAMKALLKSGLDKSTQTLSLSPQNRAALNTASVKFAKHFKKCVEGHHFSLTELLGMQYGVDKNLFKAKFEADPQGKSEMDLFDSQSNIMDGLQKVALLHFSKLRELNRSNDLSKLRIYTHEEQADEISIKVMRAMKMNPESNANFLLGLLSPKENESCLATIGQGGIPGYGLLSDYHHSSCWRAYHSRRFIQYLSENRTE